jgi:hypothetical protein
MTAVLENLANSLRNDGDALGKLAAQMCHVINRSQELGAERLEAIRLMIIETICEAGYVDDLREYAIIEVAATMAHPMNCPSFAEREELGNGIRAAINTYCDLEDAA